MRVNEFLDKAKASGIPEGRIEAVSMGDNGFWVFYLNKANHIVKFRFNSIGVKYCDDNDILNFTEYIYKRAQ
jgi:hypothetical protein